jgi:cyclophilin family peptidyl-prolyl cis-trans isomerase
MEMGEVRLTGCTMREKFLALAVVTALTSTGFAQTPPATPDPAPSEIVAAAPASDWVAIEPADLLVMTLAPDARAPSTGSGERRVVIQLMPAPFSQGWVGNIRDLAAAHWWDGLSINRVQDNYVVQWGDADGEDAAKARALPEGLRVVPETDYMVSGLSLALHLGGLAPTAENERLVRREAAKHPAYLGGSRREVEDPYSEYVNFIEGWPIAVGDRTVPLQTPAWPVHCYGMVGVGRNLSPDTGSGAELYTVIGHAPRHLDRNIALVGRVIEGIEHLSSLPRGTGALGFYESAEERVPIVSIRLATALPAADQPRFEYLSTESASFARYADARANRRDPFFNVPAGGADICNIPVPVRRVVAR